MKSKLSKLLRVVVSYDAGNGFRVRQAGSNSEHETHKEVHLYNVEFVSTRGRRDLQAEVGFGCGIAALGCLMDSPASEAALKNAKPIYFDGGYHFRIGDRASGTRADQPITRADLVIMRRGQLLAVGAT